MGGINMWITRDLNGELYVFRHKPRRSKTQFGYNEGDTSWDGCEINKDEFPEVTWENSPVEIKSLKGVENV